MQKVFETDKNLKVVSTTIDENGHLVVTYEPKMTAREFIESCFDGCQIKHDKDNNKIIYAKKNNWYFKLEKYKDRWYLWCSFDRIWLILKSKYQMGENDSKALIQDVVKDTYNMGSVTLGRD